jgi:hypothetical protein
MEIEKNLPLKIHDVEWSILNSKKIPWWERCQKLTDVEQSIPLIFIALYLFFLLIIIGVVDDISNYITTI